MDLGAQFPKMFCSFLVAREISSSGLPCPVDETFWTICGFPDPPASKRDLLNPGRFSGRHSAPRTRGSRGALLEQVLAPAPPARIGPKFWQDVPAYVGSPAALLRAPPAGWEKSPGVPQYALSSLPAPHPFLSSPTRSAQRTRCSLPDDPSAGLRLAP